jgi:hypothetical protein
MWNVIESHGLNTVCPSVHGFSPSLDYMSVCSAVLFPGIVEAEIDIS